MSNAIVAEAVRPAKGRPDAPRIDAALAQAFPNWLLEYTTDDAGKAVPLVDPMDWAYRIPNGDWPKALNDHQLYARLKLKDKYPAQLIDRELIARHLDGRERIAYTSNRASGYALVRIDVDAHNGQSDAIEAAQWIVARHFPGAYYEATDNGCAAYFVLDVKWTPRDKVNALLADLAKGLGVLLREFGYESLVEVQGGFTQIDWDNREVKSRARPGCLPRLWSGMASLDWLRSSPVRQPAELLKVIDDARQHQEGDTETPTTSRVEKGIVVSEVCISALQGNDWDYAQSSPDAWLRMQWACFEFTRVHRRLPDVSELVEWYAVQCRELATVDARTYRRAERAIHYREKTFDAAKAVEAGYAHWRERLIEAVRTYCSNRASRYPYRISDEDLAVGLYLVTRNSFSIRDEPRHQFTCPQVAFVGMAETLKVGSLGNRNKVVGLKVILERAGLITCVDPGYIFAGNSSGAGKKYVCGPAHWRHAEFVRFSKGIDFEYVGRPVRAAGTQRPARQPAVAA